MRKCLFLVFFSFIFSVQSQDSPWGVSGCRAWFKTVSSGDGKTFKWEDFSGEDVLLKNSEGEAYKNKKVRYINFNPSLYVGSKDKFDALLDGTGLSQGTIFAVFMPTKGFQEESNLYGVSTSVKKDFLVTNDKVKSYDSSTKELFDYGEEEGRDLKYVSGDNLEGSLKEFKSTSARILTYERYTESSFSVWDGVGSSVITMGTNKDKLATGDKESLSFDGYIPEFLVFNRVLNPKERRRVETYLALKYAITLDENYLKLDDEVLWDVKKNKRYNNRVTAFLRNTEGGLYQPFSTSTYDETDFSFEYDSYDEEFPYGSTNKYDMPVSRNRLLSIGESYESGILDTDAYGIWGDDGKELFVKRLNNLGGVFVMDRVWRLETDNTNFPKMTHVEWLLDDIVMKEESSILRTVYKDTNNSGLGIATTDVPLLSYAGSLQFVISGKGKLFVSFGGKDNSSYNYGVAIDWANGIYTIEQGKKVKFLGVTKLGAKITLKKDKNTIRVLKGNGELVYSIQIKDTDKDKAFHGKVAMYKNTVTKPSIKNLFNEGFVRRGMQLELSYDTTRAKLFNPIELEKRGYVPYLLIDKSGEADFSNPDTIDFMPLGYTDVTRNKLGYTYFYFDQDVSGEDAFTFGFKKPEKLLAYLDFEKPSCDSIKKGSVSVKLKQGKGVFKYQLTGVKETVYKGELTPVIGRDFVITNLDLGTYRLDVIQSDGYTLSKNFRLYGACEDEEEEPLIDNLDNLDDLDGNNNNNPGDIDFSDIEDSRRIRVFPNPVGKYMPFWVSTGVKLKNTLTIYDASGRLVAQKIVTPNKHFHGSTPFILKTAGTYYIEAKMSTGERYYKKVIVY